MIDLLAKGCVYLERVVDGVQVVDGIQVRRKIVVR